ncbi:MAG: acylphosphatase [Gemmatimonadaceae bacterium]|nr:acylphosphatase [Gloeobacterales cyanobacterium ES-bin-141]
MLDRVRAHILISGKVQGVGYRAATRRMAERLGTDGWVRNLDDGRVEAVLEGNREAVEQLIAWCRRGAPPAVVKDVAVEYGQPEGCTKFEVRR